MRMLILKVVEQFYFGSHWFSIIIPNKIPIRCIPICTLLWGFKQILTQLYGHLNGLLICTQHTFFCGRERIETQRTNVCSCLNQVKWYR